MLFDPYLTNGRKVLAPSLKSFTARNPIVSINLSILEDRLSSCQKPKDFFQIHSQMTVSNFINDSYAASRLLSFSTTCSFLDLDYSRRLLHQVESPNPFSWNTVMRSHVQRNLPQCCLPLYKLMLKSDSDPDNYTYPIILQACALQFSVLEGMQIHAHILKFGLHSDVFVLNTLINMYSVCGHLEDARLLFDRSPVLDSVSWNSILAAYVQIGDVDEAVRLFDNMPERNTIASNSMIALLGKNKRFDDARTLFDEMPSRDIVTWTAMISCYEQSEMFRESLELFYLMRIRGVRIDEVALVTVLSSCASLQAMKNGESVHGLIVRTGIQSYIILQNSLIHMYCSCSEITAAQMLFDSCDQDQISWNIMISGYLKCGFVDKARDFFNAMPRKDLVSWSTMISGFTQHGFFTDTLALFQEMQTLGVNPDETTLVSIVSACTNLSALEQGKWVHAYIRKHSFQLNVFLGTTMVDMYMKCGCRESAMLVFDEMEEKSISTWNAVILGLAMNGFFKEALKKFLEMERHGVLPNEVTFVGVLGACRHGGLVDEGREYFDSMKRKYNLEPNVKHYGCMVDLLGRAGLLGEAEKLIDDMPVAPDPSTWGALLGACRKHGDTEVGERVGRKLIEFEPRHDGFHVLLSNIYASKGKWDDLMEVRSGMKQRRVIKMPGCSIIEARGAVHEFLSGDSSHPQMEEIEGMLNEMARRLKIEGYEAKTAEVAFDIEMEEKESSVYRHSEKLAIAFGLINIDPPAPVRIMKNLRICSDCHDAAKILSKVFGREIVVRDRQRFHHFKQGVCSCADYW